MGVVCPAAASNGWMSIVFFKKTTEVKERRTTHGS
jgi:hypothetical protein